MAVLVICSLHTQDHCFASVKDHYISNSRCTIHHATKEPAGGHRPSSLSRTERKNLFHCITESEIKKQRAQDEANAVTDRIQADRDFAKNEATIKLELLREESLATIKFGPVRRPQLCLKTAMPFP